MKKFSYQLDVEEIPYNKDTYKAIFGEDAHFLEDVKESVLADEIIFRMANEAVVSVIMSKTRFLAQLKTDEEQTSHQKSYLAYLDLKEEQYRKIMSSIKLLEKE